MSASSVTAERFHTSARSVAQLAVETLAFFTQPARLFRDYQRADLRYDLIAGLTVAVVMLPQAIVFAFIAGMPPASGLYTAIIGSIVAALWGSSKHAQSGPTNTHSLLTLSVVMTVAAVGTPQFMAAAGLLTVMVGVFRLLVGVTRLGVIANFVSDAVIVGFTAGAGVLIAVGQLPYLLGVHLEHTSGFLNKSTQIIHHLTETNLPTLLLGVSVIVVILVFHKINPR